MKILLLTERFDDSIPTGVISKRIADELYRFGNDVSVVSSELVGSLWKHGMHIISKRKYIIPARILLFFSNLFQVNLISAQWRKRMFKDAETIIESFSPDIIYARSTPISVCEVAAELKKKYGIKVVMHFTDPVPAPIEWDKNKLYRSRMIRTMDYILPFADCVSFGNQAMLNYQQSIQSYYFISKSFVSPDPVPQQSFYYRPEEDNKGCKILTYLGSFHGSRNPKELFRAIERINKDNRSVKLLVYDINRTNISIPSFVQFEGRVKDVNEVLLKSDILINLDGDDKEPVFISSKLKEYLCCGRPIVSITPNGSPSRLLTDSLKTVVSVQNNEDEIYNALLKLLDLLFVESDYLERNEVIIKFTPKRVTEELIIQFKNVLVSSQF